LRKVLVIPLLQQERGDVLGSVAAEPKWHLRTSRIAKLSECARCRLCSLTQFRGARQTVSHEYPSPQRPGRTVRRGNSGVPRDLCRQGLAIQDRHGRGEQASGGKGTVRRQIQGASRKLPDMRVYGRGQLSGDEVPAKGPGSAKQGHDDPEIREGPGCLPCQAVII